MNNSQLQNLLLKRVTNNAFRVEESRILFQNAPSSGPGAAPTPAPSAAPPESPEERTSHLLEIIGKNARETEILSFLRSMNEEHAKILSGRNTDIPGKENDDPLFRGVRELRFPNLQRLSPSVAGELVNLHVYSSLETLRLDGITSLNENLAEELAKFDRDTLSLDGISRIRVNEASKLSDFRGEKLSLKGLDSSTDTNVLVELFKIESEGRGSLEISSSLRERIEGNLDLILQILPDDPDGVTPSNFESVKYWVNEIKDNDSLRRADEERIKLLEARVYRIEAWKKFNKLLSENPQDDNIFEHRDKVEEIRNIVEKAIEFGERREDIGILDGLRDMESVIFRKKTEEMLRASNGWSMEHGYFRRFDETYIKRAIAETLVRLKIPTTSSVTVSSHLGRVTISIENYDDDNGSPPISATGVYSDVRDVAIKSALIALENSRLKEEDVNSMVENVVNNWNWEVTEHDPARRLLARALVRKGYPLDTNVRISRRPMRKNNTRIILEINGQPYEGNTNSIVYEDLDMFLDGQFSTVKSGRANLMRALSNVIVKIPRYER